MVGYRNFDNRATNLKWVAWLTGGEGLHNNHHEFPSSARFALRKFEVDPAWPLIRILEILRLASVRKESLAVS
jgi:stearoyl-CoA desaturase (delta-9 desaturase)